MTSETLRFRPWQEIVMTLEDAGFEVEQAYGDWDRSPITEKSDEFIIIARVL